MSNLLIKLGKISNKFQFGFFDLGKTSIENKGFNSGITRISYPPTSPRLTNTHFAHMTKITNGDNDRCVGNFDYNDNKND